MAWLTKDVIVAGLAAAQRLRDGHLPTAEELAEAPVLECWFQSDEGDLPGCLVGYVTGHPLLPDGLCTTSPVLVMDPQRAWARTISRLYRLEAPLCIPRQDSV